MVWQLYLNSDGNYHAKQIRFTRNMQLIPEYYNSSQIHCYNQLNLKFSCHHRHWWNHSRCARFLYDVLNLSWGNNGLLPVRTICIFECIITTRWKKLRLGRLILIISDMLRFTLIDRSSLGNCKFEELCINFHSLWNYQTCLSSISLSLPLSFFSFFTSLSMSTLSRRNVLYYSQNEMISNFSLFDIRNIWI